MIVENISLSKAMEEVASAATGHISVMEDVRFGDECWGDGVNGMIPYSQGERTRVKCLQVNQKVTAATANATLARSGWKGHVMEYGEMAWYPARRR
jgi:hypothetical protein